MRYLSADYLIPITSEPIKEGVIVLDENNTITKIGTRNDFASADIEIFKGILMPGFINTHCHLELSHMKGLCPTGTKLIPFITRVVKLREFEKEVILEAIKLQDEKMWAAGIQAVGDISNKADTAEQKINSPISYYTFVEMFDLLQPTFYQNTIETYRKVYTAQAKGNGNKKSLVPHAPYSVSPELFAFLNEANPENASISIHNTETVDENLLFETGEGGFKNFFSEMGLSLDHFNPTGTRSIDYTLNNWKAKRRNIMVHNTMTTKGDIEKANKWSENVYWATCPNANLYIENNLPDYKMFLDSKSKMTIGTDSIMSNWQLDIWEEIKTIKKYQSYVPLSELLTWATINGANALGYQKTMGSMEIGKAPGVVSIEIDWQGGDTDVSDSFSRRVV